MTIGILGFGNMGEAFTGGLRRKDPPVTIRIMEKDSDKRKKAVEKYSVQDFTEVPEKFFSGCDLAVIAVKPQDFDGLLREISPFVTPDTGIISVAAGITLDHIGGILKTGKICRIMPNLAAVYGKAFVGASFPDGVNDSFRALCLDIASALGTVMEFPERLQAAVTGLSGSGIAYVFSFVHAMALGGTRAGIPYPASLRIAISLLEGAAAVLNGTGEHPVEMICRVTSPAGTTIEGISALEQGGFTAAVIEAVCRASSRASELEA